MSHRIHVPSRGPAGPCLLAAVLACLSSSVHAQLAQPGPPGSVRGVVVDTTGRPVEQAVVEIARLQRAARTNPSGRFAIPGLPRGPVDLSVRRIGFEARTVEVIVTGVGADEVKIVMRPARTVLPTISAREERRRQGILEFHLRRERGIGTFITREQILARGPSVTSDMLRTTPGVRFVRSRTGRGVRFINSAIVRRDCMPMMWVDGARAPGMELDDVPVNDIEGIELYQGPSTTPMQFSPGPTTTCGTIVVWTRQPGQ